jgi:hypothetical protein
VLGQYFLFEWIADVIGMSRENGFQGEARSNSWTAQKTRDFVESGGMGMVKLAKGFASAELRRYYWGRS